MTSAPNQALQYLSAQWVLPVSGAPIEWGFVAIQGTQIHSVGLYAELAAEHACTPPRPGSILTPGFINTHIHLEQSFPQPIAKSAHQPFIDWLLAVIEVNRAASGSSEKLQRSLAGAIESLHSGVTCVNDIASGPESLQAIQQTGLRGLVSLEVFHPDFEPIQITHWQKAYQHLKQQATQNTAAPTVLIGVSPHSLYNVSPRAWQTFQDTLNPAFIHTHLAEFEAEGIYLAGQQAGLIQQLHQQVLGKTFAVEQPTDTPTQMLLQNQLLDRRTVLAHAIHTTEPDRQALSGHPVGIAHCPRSNIALHGQTLCWRDWKATGISVGLGTDGRLSTPNLDLRDEARLAMRLHHWSASDALRALTLEGAKVLGLEAQLGSLSPGKQADLVIWQAPPEPLNPQAPEFSLLDPQTTVQRVLINGQWCYKKEN